MAVTLSGVLKRFGGRAAVDGVDLDIPAGAFFVVLGPSGCGKSTLLRLIAGLETLDAGEIALGGRTVAGAGRHAPPEDRGVAVVFQSYALWPHMTVARNVAFPVEAAGAGRREAERAAAAHLRTVALEAYAERRPAELSGGQRQRVALARCLASRARTVLMDEPLANLDPHLRAGMEAELAAFHARAGATTLYITHDQREAMALGTHLAVMREGRFEQVAAPETVYARPATEAAARFVGRAAVLPATVAAAAGGRAQAFVGEMEVEAAAPAAVRPGAARLVLRPEDAALGDGPGATPARLVSASYRGGVWEGLAAVEGWAEPVPLLSRARLTAGEEVPLRLRGGWVLPPAVGLSGGM